MVAHLLISVLFMLASLWDSTSPIDPDVSVATQVETTNAFENNPLEGTITVTHKVTQTVDTTSFRLDNQPLKVDLVKEVHISPNDPLTISIYHFQLPGRAAGSYTLSPISVTIGGQAYQSQEIVFDVAGAAPQRIPNSSKLLLQSTVEGPSLLYPGQLTKFVYRFIFKGDIQLVTETLPLLNAEGFMKVGEKEITNQQEGELNIQQVTQAVRPLKAGEFTFPASIIEGYAYQQNLIGKRIMLQPKLRAETAPLKVVVASFPAVGKPTTFNGAVGQFTLKVSLLSSPQVTVDDQLRIAVDITGQDLATVSLPDLIQAGFQERFRLSDLPTVGQVTGTTKRFEVELYPLSSEVKEIPVIAFSYFDPQATGYITLKSTPIPLTVKARVGTTTPTVQPQLISPPPIEIISHPPLIPTDLRQYLFGTWYALWVIPGGLLLLVLQFLLRDYLEQAKNKKRMTSGALFQNALQAPNGSVQQYTLMSQAFIQRLQELGYQVTTDSVPETFPSGEVRDLLIAWEQSRYAGTGQMLPQDWQQQARHLFKQLQERR